MREQQSIRLGKIRDNFATYFGFVTNGSIAEALALNQAINEQRQTEASPSGTPPVSAIAAMTAPSNATGAVNINVVERARIHSEPLAASVFSIFIDGGSGALKAIPDTSTVQTGNNPNPPSTASQDRSIKGRITALLTQLNPGAVASYVQMHYHSAASHDTNLVFHPDLNAIGFNMQNSAEATAAAKMSAFRMIHPLLSAGGKNADLLTIFFNSFPSLELVRATPVLDVKLYSSRQVFQDGRLAALSLQKSLEGAVPKPDDGPLLAIGLASQITASQFGNTLQDFSNYSIVGMELFRAPQTMVNPEAAKIAGNFLAPIIDPFRPLASIKSLDVEIKSAVGLISTKTAKLEIVLHDRSRMGEFADIIKPDRYGSSFIDVEYGWSHPDQLEDDPRSTAGNPYADILNLTRIKEHYNIVNSSFSFDDVGQVNISLSLVTRGTSEMTEVSITSASDGADLRNKLNFISELSKTINILAGTAHGNDAASTHRQEVRGGQMLGAAGDATNMLVISSELLTSLQELRASLAAVHGHGGTESSARARRDAAELQKKLTELTGPPVSNNRGVGGRIGDIQNTVNASIARALGAINQTTLEDIPGLRSLTPIAKDFNDDIFLRSMEPVTKAHFSTEGNLLRAEPARPTGEGAQARMQQEAQLLDPAELNRLLNHEHMKKRKVLSLGTLFMALVAKPLAMLPNKFEEVQVYFYNFNNKASIMSHCNISQFPITTDYFAREFSRMRLENLSRSVDLTVMDFINFLANKIVDDTMNPAYGMNTLYRYKANTNELEIDEGNRQIGRNERTKQDNFNRLMTATMERHNIGRSPDFEMPQLTVDIEAVPYAFENGESKTILKIHVYDKACSPTSPLRELLSLGTENLMSSLSTFPPTQEGARSLEQDEQSTPAASSRARRGSHRSASTAQPPNADPHALRRGWQEAYTGVVQHAISLRLIEPVTPATPTAPTPPATQTTPPATVRPQYRFIGGPKRLKEMVMQYVPHIIYGCMNTTVKSANLSTQQNAQLASINMLRSLNGDPVAANGEQVGGVPLSVYPCELSITTLGCPMIRYSQEIFVDFNTNTTADNIYYVTGLSHKIEAGNFETTIKLTPNDAFGQYRNLISQINNASNYLNHAATSTTNT